MVWVAALALDFPKVLSVNWMIIQKILKYLGGELMYAHMLKNMQNHSQID